VSRFSGRSCQSSTICFGISFAPFLQKLQQKDSIEFLSGGVQNMWLFSLWLILIMACNFSPFWFPHWNCSASIVLVIQGGNRLCSSISIIILPSEWTRMNRKTVQLWALLVKMPDHTYLRRNLWSILRTLYLLPTHHIRYRSSQGNPLSN
jgi:hypothetical protein